jgi:peptidyl-prolyl cis-trans isomerase SurA
MKWRRLTRVRQLLVFASNLMNWSRLIPIWSAALCLGLPLRAELADGVKAIVNNTAITYGQVEEFTAPAEEALRRQYATQPEVFQQKLAEALDNSLEILVERQLILGEFEAKYTKLPDSALDELVQDQIREQFGDRVTAMKSLQAQGMTYEQFRQDIRDRYIESQLRNMNISRQIVISPYKVETYYLAHQDDYKVEDEIKLRMIVLNKTSDGDTNTLALAREILSQVKEGASFPEMASVYSQGSQQKQGGDWGWVERSVLRKELADVAFALKPGQVSDVVETPGTSETPGAYYIMLAEQTRPAHVRPLSEIRDDIEKNLRTQEQARVQKQWIDSLKKKTFIRYF